MRDKLLTLSRGEKPVDSDYAGIVQFSNQLHELEPEDDFYLVQRQALKMQWEKNMISLIRNRARLGPQRVDRATYRGGMEGFAAKNTATLDPQEEGSEDEDGYGLDEEPEGGAIHS